MIVPSAIDILRTIEHTFETVIRPSLHGTMEQSAAATVSHLLRHVTLRIGRESEILTADIASLQPLLISLASYCGRLGPEAEVVVKQINASMRGSAAGAGQLATLESLADEAGGLRKALMVCLDFLIGIREREGKSPDYASARREIRRYLAMQLQAEAELIHPAFEGRGPRR